MFAALPGAFGVLLLRGLPRDEFVGGIPPVFVLPLLGDVVAGVAVVATVLGVAFAALLGAAVAVLVRRAREAQAGSRAATSLSRPSAADLGSRANIALVHLDDAVAAMEAEVGYAAAQFGEARADRLADALRSARADLAAAFALKKRLDDAEPDSATQQREWNARILSLCSAANALLEERAREFDELRSRERSAAGQTAALRALADETRSRLPDAGTTVAALAARYAPAVVAPVGGTPERVRRLLADADAALDRAGRGIDATGASAVSGILDEAERPLREAARLLDHLDRHVAALGASAHRLADSIARFDGESDAATAVRDSLPDPQTGAAVGAAVAALRQRITDARETGPTDPDAAVAALESARDALDTALAAARNERQRQEHARTALAGALLAARSQIAVTTGYIADHRAGTGAEARTRLAEARRLLALAEAEADPVLALDLARSSATHSKDADALARYDLLR